MKYSFTLFCAFLLLQFPALAQSNYQPGLVVTTAGDTLKGYIDYREWRANPKLFNFKAAPDAKETQEYDPATCKYFEVTGKETYIQYTGRISMGEIEFSRISVKVDTTTALASVFLKIEEQGENIALLRFADDLKFRLFIQNNKAANPEELIYRPYLTAHNGLTSYSIYKNQLWLAAVKYNVDSDNLKRQIEQTSFYLADISKIINKINGVGRKQLALDKKSNPRTRFFGGVALNKVKFDVTGESLLIENQSSDASYGPKFSAGADIFFNPSIQQLLFRAEVSFFKAPAYIRSTGAYPYENDRYTQTFNNKSVSFTPQIIYNLYNGHKLKFYLGAGIAVNAASYKNVGFHTKKIYSNGSFYEKNEADNVKFEKFYFALPVRAGLVLNRTVEVSALYFYPFTLTRYPMFSFRIRSAQVGINYHFNKSRS